MKNYVFMKINNPNDALSGVIIQNSGGQLDPNLLQILDPVLLHLLLPRQLCVVHQRVLQLVRTHYRQNISANVRRLSRWLKLREFGSGIISYSLVDGRDIGFGQGRRHLVLVAGSWPCLVLDGGGAQKVGLQHRPLCLRLTFQLLVLGYVLRFQLNSSWSSSDHGLLLIILGTFTWITLDGWQLSARRFENKSFLGGPKLKTKSRV